MADPMLKPDPSNAAGHAAGADGEDRSAGSTEALGDRSPWRLLLLASLGGVLAGAISWGIGESRLLEVRLKHEHFMAMGRPIDGTPVASRLAGEQVTSARLHAVFGGLFGFFMGLASGIARRSVGAALTASLLGAGLGAALGGGAAYLALPVYARYRHTTGGDLVGSLLLHCGLWVGIGAVGGLALGLGLGGGPRMLKAAGAGILGALCGVLVFEFLGALAFPLEETGLPTSATARTRLLARLLVALPSAVAASLAATRTPRSTAMTERT